MSLQDDLNLRLLQWKQKLAADDHPYGLRILLEAEFRLQEDAGSNRYRLLVPGELVPSNAEVFDEETSQWTKSKKHVLLTALPFVLKENHAPRRVVDSIVQLA